MGSAPLPGTRESVNEHTSTQLQLANGAYWHIAKPFDLLWDAVERSEWLQLPLVHGSHTDILTVAINVSQIASMRPMAVHDV